MESMASDAINRKLTTIFAADVVGYSQLMAVDEEATLKTLRAYRKVIDGLIDKHGGRIFNTAGDAVLAEFGSAVEAVRCAISIQEDLRVRNSELPDNRQMWLRIGVNVGDVMVDGEDLFGDGVNVAARLEGLAEAGGICVSGSAFDHVKNKLSIAFNDIGRQKVKNIPEPIPAYRIVPGEVAVKRGKRSAVGRTGMIGALVGRKSFLAAGLAVVVLLLASAFFVGDFLSGMLGAKRPYDGHWKVTLSSLSGCRNNNTRSFSINVTRGKIDEPQHSLPKKGAISHDGQFSIRVTDRAGNLAATQIGTITGDIGKGRFQGRKPDCSGVVTLVRLD
jgi:class 3 adenylate cyclase